MAKQKFSGLAAVVALAAGDLIPIVDVSDTTMAASGTNKKTTVTTLFSNIPVGVSIADTATSTSTSTGALRVAGGLGLVENLYMGGVLNALKSVAGVYSAATFRNTSNNATAQCVAVLANDDGKGISVVQRATTATGTTFGVSRAGLSFFNTTGSALAIGSDTLDIPVVFGSNGNATFKLTSGTLASGQAQVFYTTASTSTITGALTVAGGVGIADALHVGSTTSAGSAQYAGALSAQGGIRSGFGIANVTSGTTSRPALLVTQDSTFTTPNGVSTYTASITRGGVMDTDGSRSHTALVCQAIGVGDSGGRARVVGVTGVGLATGGASEMRHHITGGLFQAVQTTNNQDGFSTGVLGQVSLANFRANTVTGPVKAIGGDFDVAIANASGSNSQEAYGVRATSTVNITSAGPTFGANYGGYFAAVCNPAGAGSTVTTAYGIYATASGAVTNWAGWFQGDVKITGELTVDILIGSAESVNATGNITKRHTRFTGSTASQVLTLPAAVNGREVSIRNAASVTVAVARAGSDTIEGGAGNWTINPGEAFTFSAHTADWTIY